MKSAITISLCPEAKAGPFVYCDNLDAGMGKAPAPGFDAVEIFPRSVEDLNAKEIRSLLSKHNLKLAAMGTGAGWVAHKLRLTDPDATQRRRARDFVGSVIDFAGAFGAPAILGSMQGRWEGSVTREQALEWLAEALEQLGPRAHAQGVPFLYEFLNRYETNLFTNVSSALEFLKPLRTQNVKLLCDLFHMNIEEADIPAALRLAGDKVGHVHFADSNRRAIGLGHIDMPPVIAALKDIGYAGYLSAEILPLPDEETAGKQTIASFKQLTA